MPHTDRPQLVETATISEAAAAQAAETGRMLVEFITPGWGSSGYYSQEVLEQAEADRVIPAGTQMFADHPTDTEDLERPIRSIRDLMAVTVEDAHLGDEGGLVGEVEVVPQWRPFLQQDSVRESIGVSIRGSATDIVPGEAEGRRGGIIEGLVAPVFSADFVTRAGRGGRVLQLLESARREHIAATRAIGHGVAEATVNDIRDRLHGTLRDAYAGDKTYVWVRDFDATTVWFEVEDQDNSGIFAQSYTDDGGTLTGDRSEVRVVTTYQPVGEDAGDQTTRSTRPGSTTHHRGVQEDTMPNIEESELARLREDAGRVPTLTTERDQAVAERDTVRSERDQARGELAARRIIGEQTAVSFSELEIRGLVADLPLTEAGELDADAFRATVEGEVTAAREAHARTLEEQGAGVPRGLPSTPASTGTDQELRESSDKLRGAIWGRDKVKGA